MAIHLDSPVVWQKPLLDHNGGQLCESPFLHSARLKENLYKSRKAFLNLSLYSDISDIDCQEKEETENIVIVEDAAVTHIQPQQPCEVKRKRISYKTKRTSSVHRKTSGKLITAYRTSTVAELASKFDRMVIEKKSSILDDPKFARIVKRANSQRSNNGDGVVKVTRKPSVKMKRPFKSDERTVFVSRKPSIVARKVSIKKLPKIVYMEQQQPRAVFNDATEDVSIRNKNALAPPGVPKKPVANNNNVSVRAAIEIFEKRNSSSSDKEQSGKSEKPKVPEKKFNLDAITKKKPNIPNKNEKTDFDQDLPVQILSIPMITPPKRCDSTYETSKLRKLEDLKPNASFLWRQSSEKLASPVLTRPIAIDGSSSDTKSNWDFYDLVEPQANLPKKVLKKRMPEPPQEDEDDVEEKFKTMMVNHDYEYCKPANKYEDLEESPPKVDDGYEAVNPVLDNGKENIYETLPAVPSSKPPPPPLLPRRKEDPLPPRPPSKDSYYATRSVEEVSNCYESIYNVDLAKASEDVDSNYESIYNWGSGSNRDSIVSSEQQSNSLYGRSVPSWTEEVLNYKAVSVSSSERSDEWVDLSDNEEDRVNTGFILIREKQKISKKTSAWSQQLREQREKKPKNEDDSDSNHHYESLYNGHGESFCDSDSFDSDSDCSLSKENMRDSGVDMANNQLPGPPNNQTYVLTRLAASAGKHMKRLRTNWSMTKHDISKSLSRMTKRKSRTDLDSTDAKDDKLSPPPLPDKNQKPEAKATTEEPIASQPTSQPSLHAYQNVVYSRNPSTDSNSKESEKQKNTAKKGFLKKFRRSMSMSAESASELTLNLSQAKSTFYLTEAIDIDDDKNETETKKSPIAPKPKIKSSPVRPQNPPPPLPVLPPPQQRSPSVEIRKSNNDTKRATSWYAEVGLFNNAEIHNNERKRASTFWYAEVGLYQTSTSTPSSSSAENSGNNLNLTSSNSNLRNNMDVVNQENNEEYYNLKNENDYYNDSIGSCSSGDTKVDKSFSSASGDMQLLLQEEPLYQFYDAAVMESVCQGGTSDLDYDGYEEVGTEQNNIEHRPRPTAMELIGPIKNSSSSVSRTLWCEIPEVKQSTVLSTLSLAQKKLQEAKFEMMTSEASYLNSLNVLINHFIKNLCAAECLTDDEKEMLFGKIPAVKNCSEKLLLDLEKCWQDNILLHGVCEIVQKHAEENFYVYVTYCENQIKLDSIFKRLRDKQSFNETLRQLESSTACHALTLHSFLMLPMQRITRWPLLLDAVLKRLSPQDDEYLHCQYALTTLNKIVNQCNEGARRVEREAEMEEIVRQIEFPKDMKLVQLNPSSHWLVRSGPVTQMVSRGDDVKLTFGKRFTKTPLHLFLFNDLFLVTKYRSKEDNYLVLHYCSRNLLEVSSTVVNLTTKDTQGRQLIFLTILENQDEKLVELLLSCNSDSDKERWLSAILPCQSDDPEVTLYECWDCPQVTAIHNYPTNQPDELGLVRGDIINVNKKMSDGWYFGERIRDGQTGWFPSNYVEEIVSAHVRARNLKQRYRLLAFSENYLKTK